jgi:ATP-dependent 26S proteasome regulatory subunit
MQLFENDIRTKCDYILAHLQQISQDNTDRNLIFFIEEIRDKIVEIMYTSDDWFVRVNTLNDKVLQAYQKIQGLSKSISMYNNAIDSYEDILDSMERK